MHSAAPLRRLFTFVGFALLLAFPLRALEFRVLSWNGQLDGIFLIESGKRVPLQGVEQTLSASQTVKEGKELVLYREVLVEGRLVPVPVATLALPENYSRAILVLAQNLENLNSVGGFWLNDSKSSFPSGSFVFHNLSKLPVALKAEDSVHMLDVRASWVRGFRPQSRFSSISAAIAEGDGFRVILNNRLKVHPEYRVIFVFRDGRASMANSTEIDAPVEYVMIYDHEIPPPEDSGEQRITGL